MPDLTAASIISAFLMFSTVGVTFAGGGDVTFVEDGGIEDDGAGGGDWKANEPSPLVS